MDQQEDTTLEGLKRRFPHFTIKKIETLNEERSSAGEAGNSPPGPHQGDVMFAVPSAAKVSRTAILGPHPPSPTPTFPGPDDLYQEESAAVPQKALTVPAQVVHQLERLHDESARMRVSLEIAVDRLTVDRSAYEECEFSPLETREQVEEFNSKLENSTFAEEMVDRLKRGSANCNEKTRIARSLDSLFSRQLFASCSWTGVGRMGPKIPFCMLTNVLLLLRRVAGKPGKLARVDFIENLVRSRLLQAKKRLQGKPGRRAYCHMKIHGSTSKNASGGH
ncbi:AGAP005307-PA-like protein [Anopheles sinensis]|uniref:AGAP005307-PA-like protein n=1 Tax=Anopheles sinensis TaxID=74873 RepID=A0A084VGR3_ANOSI|nr:AGAP005307-PA-like protein [Anopheles sinensis]